MSTEMRVVSLLVLIAMPWVLAAGLWLHDWRTIAGSVIAFVGVLCVEAFDTEETESLDHTLLSRTTKR